MMPRPPNYRCNDGDCHPRAGRPGHAGPRATAFAAAQDGEVLVKVAAAGVNRPDVMQRQGRYPPPKGATEIPGLEIAGEVAAIGNDASKWKLGDRVMALVVGGGYAQFCAAHEAMPCPCRTGFR